MFATAEQVAQLKVRAIDWVAAGCPGADPLIPDVMGYMNRFDNLATVFSCEGHFDPGADEVDRFKDFYLMVAVTEGGFTTMSDIYKKLQTRLVPKTEALHDAHAEYIAGPLNGIYTHPFAVSEAKTLRLSFTNRMWTTDYENGNRSLLQRAKYFNVVILSADTCSSQATKMEFFKDLYAALREVANEQADLMRKYNLYGKSRT